jgi:hypothetical protein
MTSHCFSEDPRTAWLTEQGADRQMTLLELFTFTDPRGRVWDAPAQSVVDGASIPRALWTLVGSPYTGEYRRASIVHDVACVRAGTDKQKRRDADKMFYHACRCGGCSVAESIILYLGVRIGAIWPSVPQWAPARRIDRSGPRLQRSASEEQIERDFRRAAEMVLDAGEVDDIDEVERRTDAALSRLTGIDATKL